MSRVHWHVLGAGAMGCLWATHLKQVGFDVTLIVRPTTSLQHIIALQLECDDSTINVAVNGITHAPDHSIHYLLVTTKATDACDAVLAHRQALANHACVVLLQNGMGQHQAIAAALPDIRLYAGLSTDGVWRRAPFHAVHAGHGLTRFGACNHNATQAALAPALHGLTLATQWETDITSALWLKLAINCAINGLTAIYDCPNGELLDNGPRQHRMQRLCHEVQQLMHAEGVALADNTDCYAAAVDTAQRTALNRSSTLQDVRAGRASEIDALNGFVIQRARLHGIATPENDAVLSAVHALTPQ